MEMKKAMELPSMLTDMTQEQFAMQMTGLINCILDSREVEEAKEEVDEEVKEAGKMDSWPELPKVESY